MTTRIGLRSIVNLLTIGLVMMTVGIAGVLIHRETITSHQDLVNRGLTIAAMMAHSSEYAVYTENQEALRRHVASLRATPEIAYVAVLNKTKQVILEQTFAASASVPTALLEDALLATEPLHEEVRTVSGDHYINIVAPVVSRTTSSSDPLFLESANVSSTSSVIGYVRIVQSQQELRENLQHFVVMTGVVVCVVLAVGLLLALVLTRLITRPIMTLVEVTGRIAEGQFEVDAPAGGAYEVDLLASSFRRMTTQLRASQEQVHDYQRSLEAKVAERTQQLETATQEARRLAEDAQAANKAKSQFLANMSHEIRTPMNGVLGMTELLLTTQMNDRQRHMAETIHRSGAALLGIINDILDFSKIEAGKLELEHIEFDLRNAIEDAVELFANPAKRKSVELACYISHDIPNSVIGDPMRLRQILLNLLGNAMKFTSAGNVTVRASLPAQQDQTITLRIEVADTGLGIPAQIQSRLFTAFSQADGSTTRRFGGTGLGLAIVKQLVHLMDGQVGLTSTPGQGSMFWFTAQLGYRTKPRAAESLDTKFLNHTRILIVDDNQTNRDILEAHLRTWGADTVGAESGPAALTFLHETADKHMPIDLAILDIHMPGMDGIMLAKAIKSNPVTRHIELLALSSSDRLDYGSDHQTLGFSAWLTKPVRQSVLRDCLRRRRFWGSDTPPIHIPRATARALTRGRILLVEDNPINREVALGLLELLGYQVSIAENGEDAMRVSADVSFDCILMDCQMPVMDGLTATAHIREREQRDDRAHVPIIALTANAMEKDREHCLAAGMDDYLAKPFTQQALADILARWCPLPHRSLPDAPSPSTPLTQPAEGEALSTPDRAPAPIDRTAWAAITALQKPGQSNVLHRVINLFLTNSQAQVIQLRQAVQAQNYAAIQGIAHTLKSSSATLGAHGLSALAKQLEEACRTNQVEQADGLITLIDREHQAVCPLLHAELNPLSDQAA